MHLTSWSVVVPINSEEIAILGGYLTTIERQNSSGRRVEV